ncbi:50S ribosomal protein L4 [Gulosibacter sp. ACHW.36C]|jgi:large subunit ribosomal protein L4|uniref:Large ribosomal subunit protein uL4 n=1 Tax=Gulosibacter sediminis TaxID=1729695 RepID=A0ABY4MVA2_9MICO|nr:50S ribosomal protein L4 [Gulosibacter sediminis]UQN14361.1 50S ribosomal protein L4 [Gulosibacter sediminis]
MAANTIDVLDATGKKSGTVELPAELFDVELNVPLVHQVVVAQQAAARQGTHKTKNRGERSGAGRKPFKQKGTGNARQGSIRMPQHRGGGIVHGPTPRDYSQRTPKKMVAAALLQSLSDRARGGRVHVFTELVTGEVPSTKAAISAFRTAAEGRNVLVIVEHDDLLTRRSVRNIEHAHVLSADQLNAYDVLVADDVVFLKSAFDGFVAAKTNKELQA